MVSRGLKAKAPSTVTAGVTAPTPLVESFRGPSTDNKKQRWCRDDVRINFFYLRGSFKRMIVIYQLFDAALQL